MRILLITITAILSIPSLNAQQNKSDSLLYTNHIFAKDIKTVQLYKEGWNLSYPIIRLKSDEKLVLGFDLMENQSQSYYYTFIHCDKDWNKSDIFKNEYLTGFPENPIDDYQASFNTTVNYYHYSLTFPNDNVSFNLSGNYILVVYPYDNPDEPIITRRFMVSEDAMQININAHRPLMTSETNTSQQIDFTVDYSGMNIINPYVNIYAFILQNGRWDTDKRNLKPDFYGNGVLKYNTLSDKNIFPGGNEFRYFDIKSIRYQSEYVKNIDYAMGKYNVYLYPSENREYKPYFYWKDFNGKYLIAYQEGRRPDIEADYVNVYFTLPSEYLIKDGNVYVAGALNDWECNSNNIMTYNAEGKQYECTMLLKQGWYNYEYEFLKKGQKHGSSGMFEGNHYETENDYIVLVYYRNPLERYDRVVGTAIANTLNNLSN
ncbi:MAG TPA: DUF5103 domain-containing protein [Bacteroidales bacterium]|nr:DUF5103 domain-containing protein [Bacteroidales bacterium]